MANIKHYFTKEYVWMLLQIHRPELTEKQITVIEAHVFGTGPTDRRFVYAALHRLEVLEYGVAKRRVLTKRAEA